MSRLATGGLIDRDRDAGFTFDGRAIPAHPGDTLASALIAAGVRVVGRSFKYHRPRGIVSAGSEEPNALVTLGQGAEARPNLRATVEEAAHGLAAFSQNRWPSLAFDLMAINDVAAPVLGAGFYYKTFMWPPAGWERLYEPLIRRAAGLGRLSGEAAPDRNEKAHAFCDVLVIGAGPAGLMAALTAGRAGARVILADEDFRMGGRLNAERMVVGDQPGADWAAGAVAELAALPTVRLMPRTTVTGVYDGGTYGALERLPAAPEGAPPACFWRIVARRAVLAAGAHERPMAFPGNDRPGVMLAGALRAYVNRWAALPGKRVAVFATCDDGWRSAVDLAAAGAEVVALIDARAGVVPPEGPWRVFTGAGVVATRGRKGLRAIAVRDGAGERWIEVDCLGVAGGWNPALHLTCHLGARPVWDASLAAFVPVSGAVPGLVASGAAAGAFSTRGALAGGAAAAVEALRDLGLPVPAVDCPIAEDESIAITPHWRVRGAKGRAWIDFQNDVTVKDVALAVRENFRAAEHMKRYTTLGMATDQGKTGGVLGLAVLAELTGRGMAETGTTTFRPPYTPVAIAALGAGGAGQGFAPHRISPVAAATRGAPTVEAGLWHRAAWFPAPGESGWRAACDREVAMVRAAVGVTDVSTLGKIEVQGPDAAAFLDRVYANTISTLAVGRVRYGLMLRDDGFVLDDGTVARLGPARFLVTTTTGAAEAVRAHLEFAAQCLRPRLDVVLLPVTEHWAQVAVTGPKARAVLDGLVEGGVAASDLPFMACRPARVAGVAGRIFRISFSGELGFEIAVPARWGAALFDRLVRGAEALGGGPYGLEALNVLRIEKGFLTHAEMHGRTTAGDLGLGAMIAAGKDCIGKAAAGRPGLLEPSRERLVGLVPLSADGRLLAGAHLLPQGAALRAAEDQGYLTSACFSPTLGHDIALAFVRSGPERIGETLRAVCALRGVDTACRIVALPFVDAGGGRMRG